MSCHRPFTAGKLANADPRWARRWDARIVGGRATYTDALWRCGRKQDLVRLGRLEPGIERAHCFRFKDMPPVGIVERIVDPDTLMVLVPKKARPPTPTRPPAP